MFNIFSAFILVSTFATHAFALHRLKLNTQSYKVTDRGLGVVDYQIHIGEPFHSYKYDDARNALA